MFSRRIHVFTGQSDVFVIWVVSRVKLSADADVSEEHAASFFRELCNVSAAV
jgi:hypothetical protein